MKNIGSLLPSIATILVVGIVVWLLLKWRGAGEAGKATVKFVDNFTSGAVKATSGIFGIPDTDKEQCRKDKAAGDWWKATFSCSVPDLFSTSVIPDSRAAINGLNAAVPPDVNPSVIFPVGKSFF